MSGRAPIRLTPGRRAWLSRLLDGPAHRPRGNIGCDCMAAGWTEWNYVSRRTGEPVEAPSRKQCPLDFHHFHRSRGERLTEAGRRVLAERGTLPDGG